MGEWDTRSNSILGGESDFDSSPFSLEHLSARAGYKSIERQYSEVTWDWNTDPITPFVWERLVPAFNQTVVSLLKEKMKISQRNLVFCCAPVIVFLFLLVNPSPVSAYEWTEWMGPSRNCISEESEWLQEWTKEGLSTLWKKSLGLGHSSVAIKDERLYSMGNKDGQDTVYCLDAETGSEIWATSYPCEVHKEDDTGGPASTPLIVDGKIFTHSRNSDVYCLESETGKVLWSRHLFEEFQSKKPTFGFIASPRSQGDLLIIDAGIVFALNKNNGDIVWKTADYVATCSTPQLLSYEGVDMVAVFNKVGLILLKLETGEEYCVKPWTTPNFDTNTGTPLIDGDQVFITSGFDGGFGLLQLQGTAEPKTLWVNETIRTRSCIPVLWEGYLYAFNQQVLSCFEFETGKLQWEQEFAHKGAITIAGGKMLILTEKGELVLAQPDPTGFKELGRTHNIGATCWSIPVLCNQRIYLRNSNGHLVCLDAKQ